MAGHNFGEAAGVAARRGDMAEWLTLSELSTYREAPADIWWRWWWLGWHSIGSAKQRQERFMDTDVHLAAGEIVVNVRMLATAVGKASHEKPGACPHCDAFARDLMDALVAIKDTTDRHGL